jgi:hypothetical protein
MSVTVAGTVEITPWILGWGETVEVLEPPELRMRIVEIGRALANRHADVGRVQPANGETGAPPAAAGRAATARSGRAPRRN